MKKTMIWMFLMLLVLAPVFLPAANVWDDVKVPVTQLLSIVLTIFGVPLLIKWGRKMGLDISDSQAEAAINALINVLVNIDLDNPGGDSKAKKTMAVYQAMQVLPAATQDVLIKKYGSMEAAVQVAFERSSLNNKKYGGGADKMSAATRAPERVR